MSFLMRKARRAAFTVGIGALTSYFLDPQLGRQRRTEMKDRVIGLVGAVREERAATNSSSHGDGDPTGGAAPAEPHLTDQPFEPLPSDVLPTAPEPVVRATAGAPPGAM